ncbi:MAG: threonine synthase [Clostridia bacterium]|nr:threonine synthase [Clostridia bacterium]MBQ3554198.1 threonine synthase [Clostridia bacterium]
MQYQSTRDKSVRVASAYAIKTGLAADGGLYVPEQIPKLSLSEIAALAPMSYNDRAVNILSRFLTDFSEEEVTTCVNRAYSKEKFETVEIAPLFKLAQGVYFLELWHGPTCAFKDMALQILPHLLKRSIEKTGETKEVVILVATSGDTGKAALEGFRDVEGTRIIVFYPADGVSDVQKRQMVTQEGNNVDVAAVSGNFDDAQSGVKQIFTDNEYADVLARNNFLLSSANSINWGRLVPQIVYYFSSYASMLKNEEITLGEKVNFVVPTGNFGDILAAYYAKEMGLPVAKLICASNENNVLTDFINTGVYDRNRSFKTTTSPSMDILISSNLERFLFHVTGGDDARVSAWMKDLKDAGRYEVPELTKNKIKEIFWGGFCDDAETFAQIDSVNREFGYVMDTHTAVAKGVYDKYVKETGDETKTVIVSTASPFKFSDSVLSAIQGEDATEGKDPFDLLDELAQTTGLLIPQGLSGLREKPVIFTAVCEKTEMYDVVSHMLNLA